jgi:hypothetical protein
VLASASSDACRVRGSRGHATKLPEIPAIAGLTPP